ncbi:MAG: heme-binding protein, partial [Candidatus Neomarinimicrobiota bacterium]|nr:heme-binding protein [Candidatus Neomarinimicrobiota bacterium]
MFYLLNIMLALAINSQSIETPKYTIIEKFKRFEVRDYGTVITAYTTINDEYRVSTYTGFRRIANYIFGGNDKEMKIA